MFLVNFMFRMVKIIKVVIMFLVVRFILGCSFVKKFDVVIRFFLFG